MLYKLYIADTQVTPQPKSHATAPVQIPAYFRSSKLPHSVNGTADLCHACAWMAHAPLMELQPWLHGKTKTGEEAMISAEMATPDPEAWRLPWVIPANAGNPANAVSWPGSSSIQIPLALDWNIVRSDPSREDYFPPLMTKCDKSGDGYVTSCYLQLGKAIFILHSWWVCSLRLPQNSACSCWETCLRDCHSKAPPLTAICWQI